MPEKKISKQPKVGQEFCHRFNGTLYTLKVVETKDGLGHELLGKVYRSPFAAAKAIVGEGQSPNGRSFWHIDELGRERQWVGT